MKKTSAFLFAISLLFAGVAVFAQTNISPVDQQQITQKLDVLAQAINKSDVQTTNDLMYSPLLESDFQELLKEKITLQLDYKPLDKNMQILDASQVRINGKFTASGDGWNINDSPTYFIFRKDGMPPDQEWLIIHTDLVQKLSGAPYDLESLKHLFTSIKPILFVVIPVVIILAALKFAFWLWMLIDCIKRNFEDQTLWIILLIFLYIIGAILYFFIIKRKNVTRKPLEFKM